MTLLQSKYWKQENRAKVLAYYKQYYKDNKHKGLWDYKPIAPEDRKIKRGRQPKDKTKLIQRGKREVKQLEDYVFYSIPQFNENGVAHKKSGRNKGSKNIPPPPLTVEKTVGKFTLVF